MSFCHRRKKEGGSKNKTKSKVLKTARNSWRMIRNHHVCVAEVSSGVSVSMQVGVSIFKLFKNKKKNKNITKITLYVMSHVSLVSGGVSVGGGRWMCQSKTLQKSHKSHIVVRCLNGGCIGFVCQFSKF